MIRLLPNAASDGATNMAADETMLRSAAAGIASLRFYTWTTATVSLGYFQPAAARLSDPLLQTLPWVRRPSGGATLVHHHELTYSLALPPGTPWQSSGPWMPRMHRIIILALHEFGLAEQVQAMAAQPIKHGDVLCFQQHTADDVLCNGKKVAGSAQRKHRQALLQHGSILLAQSPFTPALPGIRELTGVAITSTGLGGAIADCFATETGWRLEAGDWQAAERMQFRALGVEKYAADWWNEKR